MHTISQESSCCSIEGKEGSRINYTHVDPVCGMRVAGDKPDLQYRFGERTYYFCNAHCLKRFTKKPEDFQKSRYGTESHKKTFNINPVYFGLAGTGALLVIFFSVVILANGSVESAFQEFKRLWYWIILLASGFGFQLGLFFHIKNTIREKLAGATAEVAVSGTISTGSMIACCTHGLVNLLPMLGVSAAAAFLAQYQLPLILLGVFSNLVGITIMLGIAKKHGVLPHNLLGRLTERWNLALVRYAVIAVGIVSIIGSTYWSYIQ